MSTQPDVKRLADRYVAMWNEPDPVARGALVRELWASDAVHVLVEPPEEIRDAATALAVPVPSLEVHGHDALEARVGRAYEMFVASGEHVFAAEEPTALLPGVIAIRWSMVTTGGREAVGGGLDVLSLDPAGRIRTDHQFVAP
ncbi:hypothetical protein [Actinomadura sp. WMMA1423]|uniref:hypothetical protein n=1 Tax=Actinomadura sp. WMMA1423 TaxID=2591108 RepID=UPI001146BAD6|nr:hypothetical protein [Actinomadura sp. WMMA1423]